MLFPQQPKSAIQGILFTASAVLAGLSAPAQAVDWGSVPTTEVGLFFPGQTSLEWIYGKRSHDGAARYQKRTKTCQGCHDGDQAEYGAKIAAGGESETDPLAGRRGYVPMKVQLAQEGGNLLARLSWPKAAGPASAQQDPEFETKVTLLLDDQSVEEFTAGGCWAVCHIDSKRMPAAEGEGKTKYLSDSRSKMSRSNGGGDNLLSDAELQGLMGKGVFLEFWQAQLNPGQPAKASDGYILAERVTNPSATVTASASESGDSWVVEFSRPMAGSGNQKNLQAGKNYTLGFALHDQHTEGRYHLTSLQYNLSLDGGAATLTVVSE